MKSRIKKLIEKIKKRWKLSIGILIVLILVIAFIYNKKTANQVKTITENPIVQNIIKTLDISGHVDAKEKVRLRFIAGGKLTYVGAKEGDTVKKWQTIATIDKATLQKQLNQDLNNYMKERWDWEETQDANKDQSLTIKDQRTEDKEQWDLNNTVLNVEIRDIALQNTAIYAPFSGILTTAPTSTSGMQVLASDYFEIVNPSTLVFKAAIDESDIGLVEIGQKAILILDSYEDKSIETEVSYISYTSTETSSGTSFIVEFPLSQDKFDQLLRIGMNGDIQIKLEEKQEVITVPAISIIERDDITYVQVQNETGMIEERKVTLGLETDDIVEIIGGISQSDKVVIPE